MSEINQNANVNVSVNGQQAGDQLNALQKKSAELRKELEKAFKAGDVKEFEKKKTELSKINKEAKSLERQMFDVDKVMKNLSSASLKDINKAISTMNRQLNDGSVKRGSAEWKKLTENIRRAKDEKQKIQKEMNGTSRGMQGLMGSVTRILPMLGLGAGLAGAFTFLKGTIASTQATGDAFNNFLGGMRETLNHVQQSLATMDFSRMISGFHDAFKAGKAYAEMLDLIGDLERSLQIQRSGIEVEIAQQRVIARNRQLDLKDREAAVDKIVELEQQKLDATLAFENTRRDAELKLLRDRTKATDEEILHFVSTYSEATDEVINEGRRLMEMMDESTNVVIKGSGQVRTATMVDMNQATELYNTFNDEQKEAIRLAKMANLIDDERRKKLSQIVVAQNQAVGEMVAGEEKLIRIKNQLYNELIREEKAAAAPPDITTMRNISGKTFEEWKLEQALFWAEQKKFYDENLPDFIDEEEEDKEMLYLIEKHKKTLEGQMAILQSMYEAGEISQSEFNDRMKALYEQDAENFNSAMQKKQQYMAAVASTMVSDLMEFGESIGKEGQKQSTFLKVMTLFQMAMDQASAMSSMIKDGAKVGITPLEKTLVIAAGIAKVLAFFGQARKLFASAPTPQYAEGRMPVVGASDGQVYYPKQTISKPQTGVIKGPALVSELGDEAIINGPATRKLVFDYPHIWDGIRKLSAGFTPQFADGRMPAASASTGSASAATDPALLAVLQQLNAKLDQPVNAFLVANESYIDTHKSVINKHDQFVKKVNG